MKRWHWRNPVAQLQKNIFVSLSSNVSLTHIFIALIFPDYNEQKESRNATRSIFEKIHRKRISSLLSASCGLSLPRRDSLGSEWKQKRDVKVNYTKSGVPTSKARAAGVLRNVSLHSTISGNPIFLRLVYFLAHNDILIFN